MKIVSFGFKHGKPEGKDITVLDVRPWLKDNPYNDPVLRVLDGTNAKVQAYLQADTDSFGKALQATRSLIRHSPSSILYLGCTGGKHRSVALAEIAGRLYGLPVEHRDIAKD